MYVYVHVCTKAHKLSLNNSCSLSFCLVCLLNYMYSGAFGCQLLCGELFYVCIFVCVFVFDILMICMSARETDRKREPTVDRQLF